MVLYLYDIRVLQAKFLGERIPQYALIDALDASCKTRVVRAYLPRFERYAPTDRYVPRHDGTGQRTPGRNGCQPSGETCHSSQRAIIRPTMTCEPLTRSRQKQVLLWTKHRVSGHRTLQTEWWDSRDARE